jgi:hypothetical protein
MSDERHTWSSDAKEPARRIRPARFRAPAIVEIYVANCTFFESGEWIVGRDALNARIERILQEAPGFVFRATAPAEVNHDLGRLQWHLGPPGVPPAVTGMDVAIFEHGRIRALYTFLDKPASD